jgi:hypothetical protein
MVGAGVHQECVHLFVGRSKCSRILNRDPGLLRILLPQISLRHQVTHGRRLDSCVSQLLELRDGICILSRSDIAECQVERSGITPNTFSLRELQERNCRGELTLSREVSSLLQISACGINCGTMGIAPATPTRLQQKRLGTWPRYSPDLRALAHCYVPGLSPTTRRPATDKPARTAAGGMPSA